MSSAGSETARRSMAAPVCFDFINSSMNVLNLLEHGYHETTTIFGTSGCNQVHF